MSIDVDPDWWKTLFDEVYLLTDARSIDNAAVTRQEIDIYTALAPMGRDDGILDLCGGHGRHALELCRRGFTNCTVLDYARPLLEIGKRTAAREGFTIEFVQGDARRTAWADGSFDHVLILGNSLGYIAESDSDLHILKESARLLKPGGGLVLDVTDGAAVNKRITPQAWHEIGADVVVCRQREVQEGRVSAREMVLSKTDGLIRDRTYRIRLYGAAELAAQVDRAGFSEIQVHTDATALAAEVDVGCMNHRLVVTARKL
ncbi:MAG: class I SAM-dependent methyltransferase [Desulfosarcinaceae bacterium]|jgi:D-alanine-D-alanine ligase